MRGCDATVDSTDAGWQAMTAEWYVAIDGCQKGPFSTPELRRWIREGKLAKDALVKEGPSGGWKLVREARLSSDRSGWQTLLNVIGLGTLLVIGVELFLFMLTHPLTERLAPWGLALYLLALVWNWPYWVGRKPAAKRG